jgi:flagellar basal-body rod protein FlgG
VSGGFYVGAIGLQTQQRALDTIANNIANINTTAFKRTEVRFADVVASTADRSTLRAAMDTAPDELAGVALDQLFMLNEQGAIEKTGNAMDLAIEGSGFIELMGADGRTLLWRGGTLKVNDDGLLATTSGLALKAAISVPQDASDVAVARDGTVSATVADSTTPIEIGRIELVQIDDTAAVERLDGGLYRLPEGRSAKKIA